MSKLQRQTVSVSEKCFIDISHHQEDKSFRVILRVIGRSVAFVHRIRVIFKSYFLDAKGKTGRARKITP